LFTMIMALSLGTLLYSRRKSKNNWQITNKKII
jgi:hypothetical protein